jgi:hypothetical protein
LRYTSARMAHAYVTLYTQLKGAHMSDQLARA